MDQKEKIIELEKRIDYIEKIINEKTNQEKNNDINIPPEIAERIKNRIRGLPYNDNGDGGIWQGLPFQEEVDIMNKLNDKSSK